MKPREGAPSTVPAGDLVKTGDLVAEEQTRTPHLRATLVLTRHQEPSEALVRGLEAEGRNRGLEVDLWSCSGLSHFLDANPKGQWIRYKLLGIDQEQLSGELFHELSSRSLENQARNLLDDESA